MTRQGNKYEPTVAYILHLFGSEEPGGPEKHLEEIYLQEEFELPVSKKKYKATVKNIDVFVKEYLSLHKNITSIRLDRISHIKIYNTDTP